MKNAKADAHPNGTGPIPPTNYLPARFSKAEAKVAEAKTALERIDVVDEENAGESREVATAANRVVKMIEDRRVELVAPHLKAQRDINAYAKQLTGEVNGEITRVKGLLGTFEAEKEKKRLEEVRRVEAERRAREEAERKERERVDGHKNKLAEMERKGMEVIGRALNADKLQALLDTTREQDLSAKFEEFADEYRRIKSSLLELAEQRVTFLREQERQRLEAERLEGAARRQKEEQIHLERERQRIASEKERLTRGGATLARFATLRQESEEATTLAAAEDEDRLAELEADRAKNLRKTWQFEVLDESAVPVEFRVVDEKRIRTAIQENKAQLERGAYSIPGVRIYQHEAVVLR